ncbi:hypothetical protein NQ095_18270 [Rossellomorea sp. SC111]|nr:hypothetical protein [Rossellomorea sp. SC111]MCR8850367.1 hypothetical protein [Rossellomorea sp. SC111]
MKLFHKLLATYYFNLIQSCLDEKMKKQYEQKLKFHESKFTV